MIEITMAVVGEAAATAATDVAGCYILVWGGVGADIHGTSVQSLSETLVQAFTS